MKIVGIITNYTEAVVAKKSGADILEFRVDLLKNSDLLTTALLSIAKIKSKINLPIIVTIRHKSECGKYKYEDSYRLSLFKKISSVADYIDIEFSSKIAEPLVKWLRKNIPKTKIILSYHNFAQTHDLKSLINLFSKMKRIKPDIIKIAVLTKNFSDLMNLLYLQKNQKSFYGQKNPIKLALISMSKQWYSYTGRVLLALLGSELSYGYVNKSVVPGQLSVSELSELTKLMRD